jgi:hypothetical protein
VLKNLTEPDKQISADEMETLSLDLLSTLPMEGVEGSVRSSERQIVCIRRAANPG